ncbi:hypothetical protein PF005_g24542 [Phytophthora fragariae]|uniref:Uncharacterized protein n=1 Tax=Phytophthora fragariae TaxID=53985 RepID=A0A6A3W7C9_9STRA|nr:hypothetical protein PF010_g24064 [Phytophthora fragariae]KAE9177333.1 hypothetical protein PF005_g24542 [Phytophthora fragariae]
MDAFWCLASSTAIGITIVDSAVSLTPSKKTLLSIELEGLGTLSDVRSEGGFTCQHESVRECLQLTAFGADGFWRRVPCCFVHMA